MQTGDCLHTFKQHSDWVWSVVFSPDGQFLASGSLDDTVMIWQVHDKQHCHTLSGHTQFVWSVAWSPAGDAIASGSADCTIRLWHPTTGDCLRTLNGHTHQVTSVVFSPDGMLLGSGSDDETLKLWRVKDGCCLRTFATEQDASVSVGADDVQKRQIRAVAFSPDGTLLASGGLEPVIRLWDVKTGECIRTIQTVSAPIWSLAFSPDGQWLASGGEAGIVDFVDIHKGHCLRSLKSDSLYRGMNITGVVGLNPARKSTLITLGAIDDNEEVIVN